jgi:hypothetical protein
VRVVCQCEPAEQDTVWVSAVLELSPQLAGRLLGLRAALTAAAQAVGESPERPRDRLHGCRLEVWGGVQEWGGEMEWFQLGGAGLEDEELGAWRPLPERLAGVLAEEERVEVGTACRVVMGDGVYLSGWLQEVRLDTPLLAWAELETVAGGGDPWAAGKRAD